MTEEELRERISRNKIRAYKFAMNLFNGNHSDEIKIQAASVVLAAGVDEVVKAASLLDEEID